MDFFKRPNHNQNTLYLSGIDNRINDQTKAFCKAISKSQKKSLEGQKQFTNSIIKEMNLANQLTAEGNLNIVASNESLEYAIENMYDGLEKNLHNINDSVKSFHNDFNEALSLVLNQLWYANKTLNEIAVELKIPEIERERRHHLHQAIGYFSQDMFRESSQRLIAAQNILQEKNIDETNPFILYFLGYCYYKQQSRIESKTESEKYLRDALQYFDKAVFYSTKEIERESQKSNNSYNNEFENLIKNDKDLNLYKLVYESYFFAAKISYYFGDFKKSIGYCKDAIKYFPDSLDLKFHLSKYLCADNQDKKAVPLVEHIIRHKPEFSIQVKLDGDLISKSEIVQLLERLRDEYVSLANEKCSALINRFREIKGKYNFNTAEIESKYINPISTELSKIDRKIKLNLFMDAVNALRIIKLVIKNELINNFTSFKKMMFELTNKISELENEYICFLEKENISRDFILKRFTKLRKIINQDYFQAEKIFKATKLQFEVEQKQKELSILEKKLIHDSLKLQEFEEIEEKEKKRLKQERVNNANFYKSFVSLIFILPVSLIILICYIIYEYIKGIIESFWNIFLGFIIIPLIIGFIILTAILSGTFLDWYRHASKIKPYHYARPANFIKQKSIVDEKKGIINKLKLELRLLESKINDILNDEIIVD